MTSWAGNFIVTKAALTHIPPVAYQFAAFTVSSIVLVSWSSLTYRRTPPKKLFLPIALLGVLGVCLNQLLFASGLAATTAGNAALLVATVPVFALLLSSAIGEDRLSWPGAGGTLMSLVGVALVLGSGRGIVVGGHMAGDLLVLASAITYAAFVSLGTKLGRDESPLSLTAWAFAIGTVFLLPVGVVQGSAVEWTDVHLSDFVAVLYSGVVIGIGNGLVMSSAQSLGPARVTRFQFLIPVMVVALAALFLGESVRIEQMAGGALILAGVLIARFKGRRVQSR